MACAAGAGSLEHSRQTDATVHVAPDEPRWPRWLVLALVAAVVLFHACLGMFLLRECRARADGGLYAD